MLVQRAYERMINKAIDHKKSKSSERLSQKYFGRRGTIFISCAISAITGIWMAAANNWPNLLVARFVLGFAVGAKSSTTPVYAAESAPKNIRGALTMMWQMWTAFGTRPKGGTQDDV
jgi:MFS family permease